MSSSLFFGIASTTSYASSDGKILSKSIKSPIKASGSNSNYINKLFFTFYNFIPNFLSSFIFKFLLRLNKAYNFSNQVLEIDNLYNFESYFFSNSIDEEYLTKDKALKEKMDWSVTPLGARHTAGMQREQGGSESGSSAYLKAGSQSPPDSLCMRRDCLCIGKDCRLLGISPLKMTVNRSKMYSSRWSLRIQRPSGELHLLQLSNVKALMVSACFHKIDCEPGAPTMHV